MRVSTMVTGHGVRVVVVDDIDPGATAQDIITCALQGHGGPYDAVSLDRWHGVEAMVSVYVTDQ